MQCRQCGNTHDLKACSCKKVRYCSIECQKLHWKSHKKSCTFAQKKKKEEEKKKVWAEKYSVLKPFSRRIIKLIAPGTTLVRRTNKSFKYIQHFSVHIEERLQFYTPVSVNINTTLYYRLGFSYYSLSSTAPIGT